MILLSHEIQRWDGKILLPEKPEQRVNVVRELEPSDELALTELLCFARKQRSRLAMIGARHDNPCEEAVQPHVGYHALEDVTQDNKKPRPEVEAQDCTAENHRLHAAGVFFQQLIG